MAADRFISYAQNFEDVMLWRALGHAVDGPGFYIDVGASGPTMLSVTRALYDRGWHGLNVEPLPEAVAALREARPRDSTIQAAVSDQPGRVPFYRVRKFGQTGLSTLDPLEAERHEATGAAAELIEVEAVTLAALCQAHVDGPVHVLKIDVEGAEAAVLAGADFTACRPWIVLVEATRPNSEEASEAEWEPGLLAARYSMVWFDGLNRFYLAEEHSHLARHFQLPPNVFDNYVQYDAPLQDHLAATEALAQTSLATIAKLEAELARRPATPAAPAPPSPPEPPPEPAPEPAPEPPTAPQQHPARAPVSLLHRLLRPLIRPLAWRVRLFLTGELIREMADLRARQHQTLANIERLQGTIADVSSRTDSALVATIERFLLTAALEDSRENNVSLHPSLGQGDAGVGSPRAGKTRENPLAPPPRFL